MGESAGNQPPEFPKPGGNQYGTPEGGHGGGYPGTPEGGGGGYPGTPEGGHGGGYPGTPEGGGGGYPGTPEGGHGGGYPGAPGYPPPGPYPGGGYPAPPQRGGGLGTAALVLGIVSIFLLFLCGVGMLTAIAGVVIGIIAIAKRSNKPRAVIGLVLSIATLVLGAILSAILYGWVQSKGIDECFNTTRYPTQEAAQRCLEHKLNPG